MTCSASLAVLFGFLLSTGCPKQTSQAVTGEEELGSDLRVPGVLRVHPFVGTKHRQPIMSVIESPFIGLDVEQKEPDHIHIILSGSDRHIKAGGRWFSAPG